VLHPGFTQQWDQHHTLSACMHTLHCSGPSSPTCYHSTPCDCTPCSCVWRCVWTPPPPSLALLLPCPAEAPTSMSDPLATYGQLVTPSLPPAAPSSTAAAAAVAGGAAAAAVAGGIAGSATPAGGSSMTPAASGPLSASASSTTPFEGTAPSGGIIPASSSSSPPGSSGVSRHPSGMEGLLAGEPSGGWLSPREARPAAGGPPPIKVVVGEPVKKDSAGMFGMKGG
jgi:hypothetical protein